MWQDVYYVPSAAGTLYVKFTVDAVTGFLLLSLRGKKMNDPICPESGTPMKRGVAPMTISYKDQSVTFEMPGWYCAHCGESIHAGDDMKVSARVLDRLKARQDNQPAA